MARTFISQPNQIFKSENYNDALSTGITLQSSAATVEDDFNAIRTQIRQILWANVSGSWYDAVTAPSGGLSARGLNTLNTDLTDLEQKRFLFRRQSLNLVSIATGSNFAFLSVSLGTSPANFAAVGHPLLAVTNATGSIVALLSGSEGTFGSHSVAQVSGSSVLTPKNLCIIRNAWTGQHYTGSSGKDIYGLLQVESGTLTGDAFNDSSRRTQISFVQEIVTNGTSSLIAAPAAAIGGQTIMYSYVRRTSLDDIPEDAYLSNTIFLDDIDSSGGGSGGNANLTDITLDRAIDTQSGIVSQDQNIDIRIAAGFHWAFLSGTKELWRLDSSDSTDLLTIAVDRFTVSSSFDSSFEKGLIISSASASPIQLGVQLGTVGTISGANLIVSGGAQLKFTDFFGIGSTYTGAQIPFSTASIEWNEFTTNFGTRSILSAFNFLSSSVSGSRTRTKFNAGVNTDVAPNGNIAFGTNLDAAIGSFVGKDFIKDIDVYLNGVLMLPGPSAATPNDVYPGTTLSNGDLKFPYRVRSGSQICVLINK